ncbi:MAG: M3 family metallopeptidase, partial [Pseudomonadota bacterium]
MSTEQTSALLELEETRSLGPITHLPLWSRFTADKVVPAATALLDDVEQTFEGLEAEAEPSWDGLMTPLEGINLRLGALLGPVNHLLSVKYDDELQAAYDEIRPRYVALSSRMAQSRAVFDAMVALKNSDGFAGLDVAQQRILTESIRGMERSGVHLEGAAKTRYEEIQQQLSSLSNDFRTNLVKEEKDARVKAEDAAMVRGVPEPILAAAAETAVEDGAEGATAEAGPWHFIVNGVNYVAVMNHAEDAGLREAFYRAFRGRGTSGDLDNRPVLEEMLRLRQEEAQLVGFAHYAALSIDAKMAGSVEEVWSLLAELEDAARPAAEQELEALTSYARAHGIADELAPWDVPYVAEQLREERYAYDTEALRAYFQMPKVLAGLFSLTERLYGLEIREVDADSVPVWDESVSFYELVADGEVIAGFYVDPYARPGEKRGG